MQSGLVFLIELKYLAQLLGKTGSRSENLIDSLELFKMSKQRRDLEYFVYVSLSISVCGRAKVSRKIWHSLNHVKGKKFFHGTSSLRCNTRSLATIFLIKCHERSRTKGSFHGSTFLVQCQRREILMSKIVSCHPTFPIEKNSTSCPHNLTSFHSSPPSSLLWFRVGLCSPVWRFPMTPRLGSPNVYQNTDVKRPT